MTQLLLFNITNGLIIGAFYVLMALGLSLILNLSNTINFAHGGVLVIGGFIPPFGPPPFWFLGGVVVGAPLSPGGGLRGGAAGGPAPFAGGPPSPPPPCLR